MTSTDDALIILCTCPNGDTAQTLASGLVESRRAACVNVMANITSVYLWKGKVEKDNESLLIIKSTAANVDSITHWIQEHHPYELPEVVAVPIVAGLEPYLRWIHDVTES